MSHDPEGAIRVLQDGLKPDRPHVFREADTLVSTFDYRSVNRSLKIARQLVFELAWTLLAQRRHQEAANMFIRMTELNSWYVLVFTSQGFH
jgi:hypothetical protein